MNSHEAVILRFMISVGEPVSSKRLACRFGIPEILVDLLLNSLQGQNLVIRKGQFFRLSEKAGRAIAASKYNLFYMLIEGHLRW